MGDEWRLEEAEAELQPRFGLQMIRGIDVTPKVPTWLWYLYIALGKLALLAGPPGVNKTTLALDIAARVTTGSAMPDGSTSHLDGPTDVLMYSVEDAIAETLYWRAQALGADLARIHFITGVLEAGDDTERALRLPFDWAAITQAVESTGAKLLILDPLIAAMEGDANSNSDVRRAIAGATRLGEETGCAVLGISHLNKGSGSSAMYRVLGAVSTIAAARTGLIVARHPEDDNERVLAVAKSNLGPTPPALRFAPRSVEVQPGVETVMLDWGGTMDVSADDLLNTPDPDSRSMTDECAEALQQQLFQNPMRASDVTRFARSHGFSDKVIRSARERLGIKPRRVGGLGADGRWMWELPAGRSVSLAADVQNAPSTQAGHLRHVSNRDGTLAPVGDTVPSANLPNLPKVPCLMNNQICDREVTISPAAEPTDLSVRRPDGSESNDICRACGIPILTATSRLKGLCGHCRLGTAA